MLWEYAVLIGLLLVAVIVAARFKPVAGTAPKIDAERAKTESPIERRLYDALKVRGHYCQTQVPCGRFRIDIALPAYHLAIECDGAAYHSSPEQKAHDRKKDRYLKKNGWRVMRFTGRQINRNLPAVIKKIEDELAKYGT